MNVWGWCEHCKRIRMVHASVHVVSLALNGMPVGTCKECEDEDGQRLNRLLGPRGSHRRI